MLKDILEDNVDESYYLSQEQVDRITFSNYDTNRRRIQEKEYSDTLCARDFKDPKCVKANKHDISVTDGFTIRRLIPLECWRLMGIKDEYFYKAKEVNSNTQLYKQAGNAIVVDVLEAIFKKLFLKEDVGLKDASTDFQMDITMLL